MKKLIYGSFLVILSLTLLTCQNQDRTNTTQAVSSPITTEAPQIQDEKGTAQPEAQFVAARKAPRNPFKEKKYEDSTAVITGKIIGKRDRKIKLRKKVNNLSYAKSKSFKVDKEDNTFKGEVVLHESGYYILYYRSKKYSIYLTPGDQLDVTFDSDSPNGISYAGNNAAINTYLAQKENYDKDISLSKRSLYKMEYRGFIDSIDEERASKEEFLWSFIKDIEDVPSRFVGYELADIQFEWANQQLSYYNTHLNYNPSDFESLDKFSYKFTKKLDLKNDLLLNLDNFSDFIDDYLAVKTSSEIYQLGGDPLSGYVITEKHRIMYDKVDELFKGKEIRSYMKTQIVSDLIGEDGTPTMNPVILKFRKDVENEDYREMIDDKYVKYAMIDNGSIAPDFEGVTIDGRVIKLSDFEGKYVYVDVWATWCGPCKHELPYFDQLKQEYSGRNIEFLSVSIDKSRFAWEEMVRNKNMQGNQLFVHGDWGSDFALFYDVKAVPQFILIDPEGQIIDITARHPSGRIREDLAMLNL